MEEEMAIDRETVEEMKAEDLQGMIGDIPKAVEMNLKVGLVEDKVIEIIIEIQEDTKFCECGSGPKREIYV